MKIPFGLRLSDSRMVGPELVPNGLGCGCVCKSCGLALIAKQGMVNEWHFAHSTGDDCPGGVEGAIHQMTKQMILDRRQVYAPEYLLERFIQGATWRKRLVAGVQSSGLLDLLD